MIFHDVLKPGLQLTWSKAFLAFKTNAATEVKTFDYCGKCFEHSLRGILYNTA